MRDQRAYDYWRKIKNYIALVLIGLSAIVIVLPLFFIASYLVKNGYQSLSLNFFTELPKPLGETGGGMRHAILGTLYLVGLGALIGVPWGMGVGVYLSEYGKGRFATVIRLAIDMMTGTPSIVIGVFVYALLVVPFKTFSALSGGVALAIIILPIVAKTTEEVLRLVPMDIREAGLALGLPRWRLIVSIVLRAARSGILTGVILALARASGETAPLLFTAFGNMYTSGRLLEPMASLPVQIYTYAIAPYDEWHSLAWAGSFVLILLILCLNLTAKAVVNFDHIRSWWLMRRKR